MEQPSHSDYLNFPPGRGTTASTGPEKYFAEIRQMVQQKNYPCVAALKSVRENDFMVGVYDNFGAGEFWKEIRQDIQFFLRRQQETQSTYLTYWAIFDGANEFSESEFETKMWNELSYLSSEEKKSSDWSSDAVSDPSQPGFCLSIDGKTFFVVGMHRQSSRLGRRFSQPALVFNAIEQFENLERSGEYEPMKRTNRRRDLKFQGSVNPMVEKYGDAWEAIQFSGKENSTDWKCPFHFMSEREKK